jgi:GT2 family glycosyltransferase
LHEQELDYEIILVDNNSSENLPVEFKKKFPEITLIESPINVGFAKGNNLGIAQAKGKYILLLNSDTLLLNNAISRAVSFLEKENNVAVVSARLEYPDGTVQHNCQRFPSIKYKLFELLRLQKLLGGRIDDKILLGSFFDHNSIVYPDWVWGTFFMFRRESLSKLPNQKLADDFFMYVEDVQWCMQFKKIGYKVAFEPSAKVVHLMGKSGGKKNELMEKNMKLFMNMYYSPFHQTCIRLLDKLLR